MKFDLEIERDVLLVCLSDRDFMEHASRFLLPHHFTNKYHGWIYDTALKNWRRRRELTTAKLLAIAARKQFEEEKRDPYIKASIEVYGHTSTGSPRLGLDELINYVNFQVLKGSMESSMKAMKAGDIDGAWGILEKLSGKKAREDLWDRGYWALGFEERQKIRKAMADPRNKNIIPTRFSALDEALDGGMFVPSLGIVAGTTGRGKSIFCNNLGYSAAIRKHHVLDCRTEMSRFATETRYDARASLMHHKKFRSYTFTTQELRYLKRLMKRRRLGFGRRIEVVSFPLLACDVNWIRMLIDIRRSESVPTDMIIVDSADHLQPASGDSKDPHYVRAAMPYWELKALADEGYVVWATSQLTKEMVDKIASGEGLAESYNKARIADVVVTLNQTPKQKVLGKMDMFLGKARDSKDKMIIPVNTNFEIMLAEQDTFSDVRALGEDDDGSGPKELPEEE